MACWRLSPPPRWAQRVLLLDATAAKTALAVALPVAVLLYLWRRRVARIAAALSVVAVLTAPLTLPSLADRPRLLRDRRRDSRIRPDIGLLIWRFTGERIAEHPLLGWGLDAARAIPGGKVEMRPGDRIGCRCTRMMQRCRSGSNSAPRRGAVRAVPRVAVAAARRRRRGRAFTVAAAGGSLTAVSAVAGAGWGIWQEWWLGTLGAGAVRGPGDCARHGGQPRPMTRCRRTRRRRPPRSRQPLRVG